MGVSWVGVCGWAAGATASMLVGLTAVADVTDAVTDSPVRILTREDIDALLRGSDDEFTPLPGVIPEIKIEPEASTPVGKTLVGRTASDLPASGGPRRAGVGDKGGSKKAPSSGDEVEVPVSALSLGSPLTESVGGLVSVDGAGQVGLFQVEMPHDGRLAAALTGVPDGFEVKLLDDKGKALGSISDPDAGKDLLSRPLGSGSYFLEVTAPEGVSGSENFTIVVQATPGAPEEVEAEVLPNGTVEVAWSPPESDGGARIGGYSVQATPDGPVCSTSGETSCVVSLPMDQAAHTFTVQARNSVGASTVSRESDPVVADVAPGRPTDVVAVAGDGMVTLRWAAPEQSAGSRVTGYLITEVGGSGHWKTSGDSLVVDGLVNGSTYRFAVAAVNSTGAGEAAQSEPVTPMATVPVPPVDSTPTPSPSDTPSPSPSVTPAPATVPGIPRDVTATAGDAQVRLAWSAPLSDGDSTVTGYVVTEVGGSRHWHTSGTALVIDGLSNGTSYRFAVAAVNSIGAGAAAMSESVTPQGPEPTTPEPTTPEPTTPEPTTPEPTTPEPTTPEPTGPATPDDPATEVPATPEPTTPEPTTDAPTSDAPTSQGPATGEPTTGTSDSTSAAPGTSPAASTQPSVLGEPVPTPAPTPTPTPAPTPTPTPAPTALAARVTAKTASSAHPTASAAHPSRAVPAGPVARKTPAARPVLPKTTAARPVTPTAQAAPASPAAPKTPAASPQGNN